ncbi:hypothetical protein ACQKO7_24270, partial [Pseudomonas putida]|uniref:hypothetical protein n=1 Tax=Pseudomonas putida TaxID=303 RepID=UPI003CFFDC50
PAPLHKRGAEFVKCILATVRDLGVDGSRAGFPAGTLGNGQLALIAHGHGCCDSSIRSGNSRQC